MSTKIEAGIASHSQVKQNFRYTSYRLLLSMYVCMYRMLLIVVPLLVVIGCEIAMTMHDILGVA